MSTPRPGTAGATRSCPHCKTVILESASVCPACKHHLRFDEAAAVAQRIAGREQTVGRVLDGGGELGGE